MGITEKKVKAVLDALDDLTHALEKFDKALSALRSELKKESD